MEFTHCVQQRNKRRMKITRKDAENAVKDEKGQKFKPAPSVEKT